MSPTFGNPVSSVMRWCLQLKSSAQQIVRRSMSWRTARAFCAVWFTLTSVGLPMSLSSFSQTACARSPGSQCRCSLSKRLSGMCCCSREASQSQPAKSCCSTKKTAPKSFEPNASEPNASTHCAAKATRVEFSIARCDCAPDSPDGLSLVQEPRMPVAASAILLSATNGMFDAIPVDRVESTLLFPPVPPPKIVL